MVFLIQVPLHAKYGCCDSCGFVLYVVPGTGYSMTVLGCNEAMVILKFSGHFSCFSSIMALPSGVSRWNSKVLQRLNMH